MPEETPVHPKGLESTATAVEEAPGAVRDVEAVFEGGATPEEIEAVERDIDRAQYLTPYVVKEAKAGYKTTEFWLALVGVVLAQVGALDLPGHSGKTIATVALLGSYALSRGVAKSGVPAGD